MVNEIRCDIKLGALIKMGPFLISGGELNERRGSGEGWPRKFYLKHFINGSSKTKMLLTKI
jgi:hypothetical protein